MRCLLLEASCLSVGSASILNCNGLVLNIWQTFETSLFVQSGHSNIYCLCDLHIQNFIVCAIETFKTLFFVQSGHSNIYCLCNQDIQNFIVCAIGTFKTLLFVQMSYSKLYCLRVPSGAPYTCPAKQC